MNVKPQHKEKQTWENNKPAYETRIGKNRAAVWKNQGKKGAWYNVTVTRSYLDGTQWKDTTNFRPGDLPAVGKLAEPGPHLVPRT